MQRLALPLRSMLRAASLLLLTVCAAAATAQTYPDKPVKLIVPYAAGGFSDALARLVAQRFTESLGQTVVVENKPGASTNIGFAAVAKSPPDGYTLVFGTGAPTINPFLFSKMPYDAERDFAPIGRVADLPYVLFAHPSVPAATFKELIAYCKAHPGKLNIGTPGNGTTPHLAVKLLEEAAGISLQSVHYKGNGPALNDLLGGQIQLLFDGLQQPQPFVRSGKLKALAVASPQRIPSLPDAPAIAETYPGYEAMTWYQLLAPAGTPAPAIAKLNAELRKFIDDPAQRAQLLAQGAVLRGGTPAELAEYTKAETARWGAIIKKNRIQLD
ncbi:MAG: tripartite tricarboxylate transporter substrate binding protein [Burkholderiales bacterium]|nr:tripartite tricarboxylate transporter substrate binding protein [Burkholderiales bacterium]